MTGNKCLLDTSVILHFFKKDENIIKQLDEISEVFVSTTVVGELYYGAFASASPEKHATMTEDFLQRCKIISVDKDAAVSYGSIKAQLKIKGKPIPENDILIAAVAHSKNLPLFTTDNHFAEITGIIFL